MFMSKFSTMQELKTLNDQDALEKGDLQMLINDLGF
jgi:hypothetical protein